MRKASQSFARTLFILPPRLQQAATNLPWDRKPVGENQVKITMYNYATDIHATDVHVRPRRYLTLPNTNNTEPNVGRNGAPNEPGPAQAHSALSAQMHLQSGLDLYAQGETLEALWSFFEAVGAEPRDALGRYLCGLALRALGLETEAQTEWKTVLILTSAEEAAVFGKKAPGDERLPDSEMQWVRTLVQRLLEQETNLEQEMKSPLEEMPVFKEPRSTKPGETDTKTVRQDASGRQEELERSILEDVRLYGNCYVKDRHIASRLTVTTEEEILGWKQAFSERKGLEYSLYQKTPEQSSRHEGVIFTRSQTAAAKSPG